MTNITREVKTSKLYAYGYNALNDVYTVRGILPYEVSFEARSMSYIPEDLLNQMQNEYSANHKNNENIKREVSFSKDGFYAVVDFNGRTFTSNQVVDILDGKLVNAPSSINQENSKRKSLSIFSRPNKKR